MLSEVLNNAPVQVQNKNKSRSSHLSPSYLFVQTIYSIQFSISLVKQSQSTITSSCNLNVPPTLKKNSGPFIQVMCSCCSGAQMQLKQNGGQGSIKRINHKLNKTPRHKRKSRYMGTETAEILIFQCLQTSIRAEEKCAGRGLVGIKEPPRVRTCRDGAFSDCEPGFNLFLSKWKNPQPPRLPTELLLCQAKT